MKFLPEGEVGKETVNPIERPVLEKLTPDLSAHRRKIDVFLADSGVPFVPAEPPVDWDTISIEVQDTVPNNKRLRHDANSGNLSTFQVSLCLCIIILFVYNGPAAEFVGRIGFRSLIIYLF